MARQAPPKTPDRHYNFGRMNLWFAWSAIALFATTVWMVADDYAKPWKRFQAEFRELERVKVEKELAVERERISGTELTQLEHDIAVEEETLRGQGDQLGKLEEQLRAAKDKVYEEDARSRAIKSHLDTERYLLDVAVQSGEERALDAARAQVESRQAELAESKRALEEAQALEAAVQGEIDALRAERSASEEKLAALRKGVETLETRLAGLDKGLDFFVLNSPLMDMLAPSLEIKQVMLDGLYHDINFAKIGRVDRCMTCHVASNRPGFEGEEWAAPFRTHPRLDLFVGDTSPHPYSRFGCTACHGGLDRATDFARAGHTVLVAGHEDEERLARWKNELDWEKQPFLETPIMPAKLTEAGCVGCHAAEVWTPGSQSQDVGRELITRMGCYGCHEIDAAAYRDMRKAGPDLTSIGVKTTPGWAYKWIEAPREFHPTTWMPHFFHQENIEGELNQKRQQAEIAAIVAYLWEKSAVPTALTRAALDATGGADTRPASATGEVPTEVAAPVPADASRMATAPFRYPAPPAGDPAAGKAIFESVGCTGCHILDGNAKRDDFYPEVNRLHGPNLVRTGSKVDSGWLYAWVRNPTQYFPGTVMPDLRLTDEEAADVTAYLLASRDPKWEGLEVPAPDPAVRQELVERYLASRYTLEESARRAQTMSAHEQDVYLGEQAIRKYGCYGCHGIAGFEDAKPIGTELTEEGSKPVHQFDFGHVHEVPHTRADWIRTKVLRPRIWDEGRELVKDYDELLKMPNFGLSEREAQAVLTNVLGFTKESIVADRRVGGTPGGAALAEGRKIITRYNCRGCHLVEGAGHAIRTSITDPGLLPPNLASEGARVQSDWLFDYLHDPAQVRMRPWLTVRMPTFPFDDGQLNTLAGYFQAREETSAFHTQPARGSERDVAVGRQLFTMLQCAKCHPTGPSVATGAGAPASAAELAPSLLLAEDRLRHDWVDDWVKDPQKWIPGTKMPSFFPQDASGQYVSQLGLGINSPVYAGAKAEMLRHFASEDELRAYLADVDQVTAALRDYIWTLAAPGAASGRARLQAAARSPAAAAAPAPAGR